jgi:benzoyl-CoA reductase/2-hydroxyglutaryl-CoA dehydratase subunit BcrC/BadD/HgdB
MKTWADIAKKNTNQRSGKQLTENSVKQAVRIVHEEERRSKNLMIYGYPET